MINIVIATQQPIFRAGLSKLIATEDELRIVAQPLSVAHLHNAFARLRPQLVLLSSDFFPSMEDLASVVGLIAASGRNTLALTETPEQALEFLAMGVQGVLPRKVQAETLVEGIRRVGAGEMCVQTEVDAASPVSADSVGHRVASRLSRRELRIMAAMLRGLKNADIAEQLGIALPQLKKYIGLIYDKAGVWGRLELALFMKHHQVLALVHPCKLPARTDQATPSSKESLAVEKMFPSGAKPERPSTFGPRVRGTSLATTGAPPECGK